MNFDQLRRRDFVALLGGAAAAWPLGARAQQGKVWRIGYLHPGFVTSRYEVALLDAFRQELNRLGYNEGRNVRVDIRNAEGRNDRLPALAGELVALHPNVIVAVATPAIAAAQRATSTIPIVMTPSSDPVGSGFVKSFARPGANITGLANMFPDLTAKSVEILHTIIPGAKKIAILMSSNPTHPPLYEVARNAAVMLGLFTVPIVAAAASDLDRAFEDIGRANCDAVFVLADPIRPAIVSLAATARIPAIYQFSEFVKDGGLASYGPNLKLMWTRSAQYVDRIFKGANPADMPVEQPTKFELVINQKTAKSLGLEISPTMLLRADEVIE
jgi:putative ABC transport system substrate-binding protein